MLKSPFAGLFVPVAWLQPEGDLANPHYGSEMLTCGEIVES